MVYLNTQNAEVERVPYEITVKEGFGKVQHTLQKMEIDNPSSPRDEVEIRDGMFMSKIQEKDIMLVREGIAAIF